MHVLQHAARIVGHIDAEQLLHLGVPRLGQVVERERAGDELLLELEAEDDVERVGDLVRVDPDQPGRDAVDPAVPRLEIDGLELREEPLQLGQAAAPERERAADEVLPRAALRLAEAERRVAVQRRARQRRLRAQVGQAMAGLVHRGPERAQVGRLVARRHPDVGAGEGGRERVHGRVEPVGALREAEVAQDAVEELLLRRDREVAFEERVIGGLAGLTDDRRQLRAEHVEDGLHLGRRHPRLVLVEEGVVGRVALLHVLRPAERDVVDALEGRPEDREVVRLARLEPGDVCLAALARPVGRELGGDAPGLLPVAASHPDQARIVGVEVELGLERRELVEQPADLVGGEPLVCDPGERRRDLRACGSALRRHHRPLVPAGDRAGLLEVVDLGQPLLQIGQSCIHRR